MWCLHRCRCPAGYRGLTCSKLITRCRHAPCRHGGVCHDMFVFGTNTVTGYRCICPRHYRGRNCERHTHMKIHACHEEDEKGEARCHHGGTCYVHRGVKRCICTSEYTGRRCETRIHIRDDMSCKAAPCHNGGRCEVRSPFFFQTNTKVYVIVQQTMGQAQSKLNFFSVGINFGYE